MRLLFVGFGTVAQGLSELLIEKKQQLEEDYDFSWKVTGIVDPQPGRPRPRADHGDGC